MSMAMLQRIKALERLVEELKKRLEATPDADLAPRVKALENKYVMLNARLNKKTNNGDDRRSDPSSS